MRRLSRVTGACGYAACARRRCTIALARRASARHDRAMPTDETRSNAGIRRVADLRLRGDSATIPVRVRWPRPAAQDAAPPLLLLLPDAAAGDGVDRADDQLAVELCSGSGAVVLCVPWMPGRPRALDRAEAALTWASDHGAELGGDPARLIVAGRGAGAAAAAALALRARDRGWPSIRRQVLVLAGPPCRRPGTAQGEPPEPAVVKPAPAILVTPDGRQVNGCADCLRANGADVEVLNGIEALPTVLREALA